MRQGWSHDGIIQVCYQVVLLAVQLFGTWKATHRGECCVLGYEWYVGLVLDCQKLWWREHHIAMIHQRGSREKKRRKKDNYVNKKLNRPPASFPFLRFLRANTRDIQIATRRLSLKGVVCVYERFFKRFQWCPWKPGNKKGDNLFFSKRLWKL